MNRAIQITAILLLACSCVGLASAATAPIRAVPLSTQSIKKAAQKHPQLGKLLRAAAPTIGTPYDWGGTRLEKGIDCSNYTWQLFRKLGLPYERYLGTQFMSRIHRHGAFQRVPFKTAQPGDLLVYGYDDKGTWRGHVVILIDPDGSLTGHKGLTLGAHGKPLSRVAYITYRGFDQGYFKAPRLKLTAVLRNSEFAAPRKTTR